MSAVEIDASDVRGLAGFWAAALGWAAVEDAGAIGVRPPGDGLALRFVPSDRAKTGKNRLHLDLAGGADQAAEVARLLALGATRADIGQGEVPWDVLADPEGNELCVLREHRGDPGARLVQICLDAADADVQARFWTEATGWTVERRGEWGVSLRAPGGTGPALVMGPPAAPKTGPNRLRFLLTAGPDETTGLPASATDPEGNEFRVTLSA